MAFSISGELAGLIVNGSSEKDPHYILHAKLVSKLWSVRYNFIIYLIVGD